jgi:hypothetical protein
LLGIFDRAKGRNSKNERIEKIRFFHVWFKKNQKNVVVACAALSLLEEEKMSNRTNDVRMLEWMKISRIVSGHTWAKKNPGDGILIANSIR